MVDAIWAIRQRIIPNLPPFARYFVGSAYAIAKKAVWVVSASLILVMCVEFLGICEAPAARASTLDHHIEKAVPWVVVVPLNLLAH